MATTLTARLNAVELELASVQAQLAQLRAINAEKASAPPPTREKKPFLSMASWVPLFKQAHPNWEGCIPSATLGAFICDQRAKGISP